MEADIPDSFLLGMSIEYVQDYLASKGVTVSISYTTGRSNFNNISGRVLRVRLENGGYHLVVGFEAIACNN